MGTIRQATTGRESVLLLEHLVGRSNRASLHLPGSYVSAQHAVFRWSSGRWFLKDLGSRNGTYIDGALISPGQSHPLALGARVMFGRPEETWDLEDASAPRPMLLSLDDELTPPLMLEGEMLPLPSADNPHATLFRGASGEWILELASETLVLKNQEAFALDGQRYRFTCPDPISDTSTNDWPESTAQVWARMCLSFRVSRDEEYVEMHAELRGQRIDLGSRGHNYLLLTLARQRLNDQAASLPDAECGWMYQDAVASGLRVPPERLNVDIFRIRKQFYSAGLPNPACVVERRPRTKQLRLGLSRVSIAAL